MIRRAFFIGGPGTLSGSAIQALSERGYQVAVYSRSTKRSPLPLGVRFYPGQRSDMAALTEALADFRPDVVLDFICYTPAEAETIKSRLIGRVHQFIFVSTVDVYGYPLSRLPFREDDPWHPQTQSQYAADKRLCEKVFAAAGLSNLPLTIARPAYSFGPRFILTFTSRDYGVHLLGRLKDNRPVLIPGDGTTLMHTSAAENTGRMIAALVDAPQAIGKDYTCGHPTFSTHSGYIEMFAAALGVQPDPVYIPTETIIQFPEAEARTCLLHALTRYNVAFSIDRFLRDFPQFRWEVTLEDWAKQVAAWNVENGQLENAGEEIFDDRVIAAWQRCVGQFRQSDA